MHSGPSDAASAHLLEGHLMIFLMLNKAKEACPLRLRLYDQKSLLIINPDSKTSNSLGRSMRQAFKCDINVVMNGLVVWANPEHIFSKIQLDVILHLYGYYREIAGRTECYLHSSGTKNHNWPQ